jgi:hypothetical protein
VLDNLAQLRAVAGEARAARSLGQEAWRLRQILAEARPDAYQPRRAATLHNLGLILGDEESREMWREAATIYERLAAQWPGATTSDSHWRTAMIDQFDPILSQAGVRTRSYTIRSWSRFPVPSVRSRRTSSSPPSSRHPVVCWSDGRVRPPGYLELHDGDWSISLRVPGNREHFLAVVIAGVLIDALDRPERIVWLVPLLPALVDVRSVAKTSAGLRITLVRRSNPHLPEPLFDTVNRTDFADLAAATECAPHSTAVPSGVTVTFGID